MPRIGRCGERPRRHDGNAGRKAPIRRLRAPGFVDHRHLAGRLAEWIAAALLMLKGYRVLERRHRSRSGEVDVIATRGQRIAFVEVKFRRSLGLAAAAISDEQAARIASTAERWVWQHPRYQGHEIGLDAILLAPGRLPRHAINALQPYA